MSSPAAPKEFLRQFPAASSVLQRIEPARTMARLCDGGVSRGNSSLSLHVLWRNIPEARSAFAGIGRHHQPPECYLCPRNSRAVGDANPDYKNTFVFVNDYSAVKEDQAEYKPEEGSDGRLLSVSYVDIMIDDIRPRRIPPQG
ncbi:galactose-1-phosphate uridylyltransferase [Colletotrichum chrysophilum]|uniref:Galactose-1-phosphate uridylyltransferase n=1 Tax=Colletotrichum chrysophilum TaxID=1836956 RepID=A0AAD9AVP6_9PEZI|nr:galactose-1-phosphate uridylyltransferase [Colletotrichum chrysophilum]